MAVPGSQALLRICFVTLLPRIFDALRDDGVVGAAIRDGKVAIDVVNPRDFTADRHHTVDDAPYGGGPGMVLKPGPLAAAIDHARLKLPAAAVCCLAADGRRFDDMAARELAVAKELILVCGRYQGIDERIMATRIDRRISVGDYITSGGELPAMMVTDAVARYVPGVLGKQGSLTGESFANGTLAAPCYTRPETFEGMQVPAVLLSGDHARIEGWREEQAGVRTEAWRERQRDS